MKALLIAASLFIATSAIAQSPYQDHTKRHVKALSDKQIDDLSNGRGMGMAIAAELNGYPGPMHVLELGKKLHLTPEQKTLIEEQFKQMKTEAITKGRELIALETELDKAFADRTVTPDSLADLTARIAAVQGTLRATHLKFHLETTKVLSEKQIQLYAQLRGYHDGHHSHGKHHRPHH